MKNKPSKTGRIHLIDLVEGKQYKYLDKFYIGLNKDYKKDLYATLLKTAGTIKNLSKETNISFTRLWDQLTRVPLSIEVLKKLSSYLESKGYKEFSFKKIEKNINYIKSSGSTSQKVYTPTFPINLKTKNGIRIIAHLYHDGCISNSTNRQPLYINQSLKEIKQFLKDGKKTFGKFERNIEEDFGNGIKKEKYFRVHLPTVVGNILIKAGFIPGDKTKNNPPTFDFMNNLKNKELIREYLAKAFNDDGYVRNREIVLEQSSLITNNKKKASNILKLNKILLQRLGIKVNGPRLTNEYKNRYRTCTKFRIEIFSKRNLKKFYENIKLIDYKDKRLENYLIRSRELA